MCGIAGLIHREARPGNAARLARARERLAHRGPDDWGLMADGPGGCRVGREMSVAEGAQQVLLLHLRLSILDLSSTGWQPMCSADGRYAIVFNGELYNYVALRQELTALGRHFVSSSDTEVLLAALVEWGLACLGRLVGMFAFAWYDCEAKSVVLARDSFGIKPLYYTETAEGAAFASEIPALLELTGQARVVVPEALGAFLRFGITDHDEGTMFAGVRQVPPGQWLRINLAPWLVSECREYWRASRRLTRNVSLPAAAAELREAFRESVRLHLQSDVPVGAALSGGIDSSAIVGVIRDVAPKGTEIHAFSFIPDDPSLSEERWIRLAAEYAGAHIHAVRPEPSELSADLARVIRAQGEPFGSPSIYAQYRVFRLAAQQGIKVMLNGQGADELLAGYPPYLGARLAGLVRRGAIGQALRLLRRTSTSPGPSFGTRVMHVADFLLPSPTQGPLRRLVGRELLPSWMDASWFAERGAAPRSVKHTSGEDVFWDEMARGLSETSLPHLLRYDDRNSMAASIESRVPFLTAPLVDFCWSLPEEFLLDDYGVSKRVFRDAMRGLVPDPILDRRDKVGFVTPVASWMMAERSWVDGLLAYAEEVETPGIDVTRAKAIWANARSGRMTRLSGQLWRCVSYIEWSRQFNLDTSA
ncbi:MAG: asparagine synthase (glutamine-hydrolyzing) [Gemmatimonadaceae bacterium]